VGSTRTGDEGDIGWFQSWPAHIHSYLSIRFDPELDEASGCFDTDLIFISKTLIADKASKTAGSIAALLHLAPIGIEDAIIKIGCWRPRHSHQQQLITAHPKVTIGDSVNLFRLKFHTLGDTIDDYKVIAQTLHLGKSQLAHHRLSTDR
jgi:hypothetical protein